MDLALTESQEMLKGIARSFMAREAPKDVIVGLEHEPSGLIPELWKKACGLGWLGMLIPAEYGGGEASLCDTAVLYEELGRGPSPGRSSARGCWGRSCCSRAPRPSSAAPSCPPWPGASGSSPSR